MMKRHKRILALTTAAVLSRFPPARRRPFSLEPASSNSFPNPPQSHPISAPTARSIAVCSACAPKPRLPVLPGIRITAGVVSVL